MLCEYLEMTAILRDSKVFGQLSETCWIIQMWSIPSASRQMKLNGGLELILVWTGTWQLFDWSGDLHAREGGIQEAEKETANTSDVARSTVRFIFQKTEIPR